MTSPAPIRSGYAAALRAELCDRARAYAAKHSLPCVETYGAQPVAVFPPYEPGSGGVSPATTASDAPPHGNFFPPSYRAILADREWRCRLDKIHTRGRSSLPRNDRGRWRELDACTSSDALLMNIFCCRGIFRDGRLAGLLGLAASASAAKPLRPLRSSLRPEFGLRARVPLSGDRYDRTEVDMRLGSLLIEAKLTESDFQTCAPEALERYAHFREVFDVDELPRISRRSRDESFFELSSRGAQFKLSSRGAQRRGICSSFAQPECSEPYIDANSGDWSNGVSDGSADVLALERRRRAGESATLPNAGSHDCPATARFPNYQLIRNVLAANATGGSFCVLADARRPDLIDAWYSTMRCVRDAELRVRCQVLTWQELASALPKRLRDFLDEKYGIA